MVHDKLSDVVKCRVARDMWEVGVIILLWLTRRLMVEGLCNISVPILIMTIIKIGIFIIKARSRETMRKRERRGRDAAMRRFLIIFLDERVLVAVADRTQ